MKKLIIFLTLSVIAFSETVSVNMDYLMSNHPKIVTTKQDIENEKMRLEEILNKKSDELSSEKKVLDAKKDKVTKEDTQAFTKKEDELQALYSQSQKSLVSFKNDKMKVLYDEFIVAIKNLNTIKKYDAVVEKNAIYSSVDKIKDISDDVLSSMKSK